MLGSEADGHAVKARCAMEEAMHCEALKERATAGNGRGAGSKFGRANSGDNHACRVLKYTAEQGRKMASPAGEEHLALKD